MTKIETLYHKTYPGDNRQEPMFYIENYESNIDLIENSDTSISNPDYDGIMRLTADYALSLSEDSNSIKALSYLDKAIKLFHNSSVKELNKVPLYESLLLRRGIHNFNNRKYSIAAKDFAYLETNYPENDMYKNWFLAAKMYKLKKYLNMIWGVAFICLIFDSFIEKELNTLKQLLFWTGITCLGVAVLQEIYLYFIKRKVKTAYNSGFKL